MTTENLSEATERRLVAELQSSLTEHIGKRTVGLEDTETEIDSLLLFRREAPTEPCPCLVEPSIVMVVRGEKQLLIGEKRHTYNAKRFLLTSLDLPANSQVLEASRKEPCLGLVVKLDLGVITELISQTRFSPQRIKTNESSASLGTITPSLLEPISRLVTLLDEPEDIPALAPLIEREIHYRLLKTDLAPRLWQLVSIGSKSQRISSAIDWLKLNFTKPLSIEGLAEQVQMSTSSLHHYFKQFTAKSPLQYQKWLRLSEARRLMLNEGMEAAQAAFKVGYESPSQFSREYGRLYGAPPKRDIEILRNQSTPAL